MPVVTPLISILLPYRDEAALLSECLASIRAQTLEDWELVAVDDGSEDGSSAVVERWAAGDPRVRIARRPREGLVAALNRGLAEARAPLVARMDADDVMHAERLAAQHAFLAAHPEIALCGTQVELFPAEMIRDGYAEYARWQNGCVTPEQVAANVYVESPFAHPSIMARAAVLRDAGGYRDGPFPEDYELFLRLHAAGHAMAKVPRVLLRWRERPARTSRVDPRYARDAFDELRAESLARDPRLHAGREIVIWGAGRRSRLRAERIIRRGIRPIAWIDIDPRKIGQRSGRSPFIPPSGSTAVPARSSSSTSTTTAPATSSPPASPRWATLPATTISSSVDPFSVTSASLRDAYEAVRMRSGSGPTIVRPSSLRSM